MINFRTYGDNSSCRTLLMVHGLGTDGSIFEKISKDLSKEDFFIVAPDLRGCGQSAGINGQFSIREAASDLTDILETLERTDIVLLGYSHGGTVVQEMARIKPELVNGLILANTFSCNIRTLREKLDALLMYFLVRWFSQKTIAKMIANQLKSEGVTDEAAVADFKTSFIRCDKKALTAFVSELRKFDSSVWLNQVNCPSLIIRGENDSAVPGHHADELMRLLTRSRIEIIPRAGHAMLWTHRLEMVDIIKKYAHFLWK